MPLIDSDNHIDLVNQCVGFFFGVAASTIVGLSIYFAQRRDDEKQQRRATMEMYLLWKEGKLHGDSLNAIHEKLDVLLVGKTLIEQRRLIADEFVRTDDQLLKSFKKGDAVNYLDEALKYKALADAWADSQIDVGEFDVLGADGKITLERILMSHKAIFPEGYAWGGYLRNQSVTIIGRFGAESRTVSPMMSSFTTAVLPPEKIGKKLSDLIERWNSTVEFMRGDSRRLRISELASFHQEFLLIHPFTDGNGRIARVILNEQASFLFGTSIHFKLPPVEYYEALHLADMREPARLQSLLEAGIP